MLSNWIKRLRKNELYSNILLLISGNGIAQLIPLLAYPVLTRLFPPEEFGLLAFLFSIHTIALILSSARLDMAIILPRKDREANSLVSAGISIAFAVSALLPLLVLAAQNLIHNVPGIPDLGIWYYLLSLTVFFTAWALLAKGWGTRFKLFKTIVFYTISLNLLTSGLKLVFGFAGLEKGLILAFVIAQVLAGILVFIRLRYKDHKLPVLKLFSREDFRAVKPHANFPKYNMPHALINTLSSQLPVLILTFYFSQYITGQFAVAYALLFKPVHVYAGSVSQALSQKCVELIHHREPIWPMIRKYMIRTFLMALGPVILILLFAPGLFEYVLGDAWTEAGHICRAIVVWPLAVLFGGSLSFIPNIFNKQFWSMLADMGYIVLRLGALMIGVLLNNVYLGLFLYALTALLVIGMLLIWYRKLALNCDRKHLA